MLSVKLAKEIVRSSTQALPPRAIPLAEATGFVLSENIYATVDLPDFAQSNVDGYAISLRETTERLPVIGEMAAGAPEQKTLQPQTAMRIFTGAPVPEGADTVVMQEKTFLANGFLHIQDPSLHEGMNIRPRGSDIKKGELAIEAGSILTPGAIGYLASQGITAVTVYPAPSVSIIVTGKELITPGTQRVFGQVFESGSFILQAALKQQGVSQIHVSRCDDSLKDISDALGSALEQSDLVLLTGGVSVGDYDFVSRAAEDCGVTTLFHQVKQKPGKPLYFGKKDQKPVFGLPGNPSSVLTCFYEYVTLALEAFLHTPPGSYAMATLSNHYQKAAGLTHFLKGINANGEVTILSAQESYRMSSFARSNCLVILPEEETDFAPGHQITIHVL